MSDAVAGRRRWLAPEVVQSSAMDCGPAALKCLLEGFRTPVSYGRLREACQTDVDGTSIDTMEEVANQLGMPVEQVVIPSDHVFLDGANAMPAIAVVRHRDGATHFVVVWRRHGGWLQVMDPAVGRRWVRCETFSHEMIDHAQSVPAADWREWAASQDGRAPLTERLRAMGASRDEATRIIDKAMLDPGWFAIATLDASVRLTAALVRAGGVRAGATAIKLVTALFDRTCQSTQDIHALVPVHYWSVTPDTENTNAAGPALVLRGAVLLRVTGTPRHGTADQRVTGDGKPLSLELAAALNERMESPLRRVWDLLKADGLLAPLALVGAMIIAAGAVLVETLLFRGLFDMAALLTQPAQRLAAVAALMAFVVLLLVIQIPIFTETLRLGRHLETRLRMALLAKLPRLADRYFHSRPISDMAERSHALHLTRHVPATGLHLTQMVWELVMTLVGILLIDAASAPLAVLIAVAALGIAAAVQPLLNERDLTVHNHAGALHTFYLDALLGLAPVRAHGAQGAVSRQHEGLLVAWARAARGWVNMALAAQGVQALVCAALAAYLLVTHFQRTGGVSGADLLLAYWVLKLPAIGHSIATLAHQYPAQRNVLIRLMEPLSAPEESGEHTASTTPSATSSGPTRIAIHAGRVVAGGHALLQDIHIDIRPGEHVAVVGKSGAGKSTLLGLLLGWHRLAEGELRVDGEPLSMNRLQALRRATAWVDPGLQIWNAPLLDNLCYASTDDGSDDGSPAVGRASKAMDAARLKDVLQKLPQGLQTYLGEGGGLLSGGEGQRVRLARAFVQSGVRLALLDEPFRGMDRAQRAALLSDARSWWRNATLICVTHDVGETLGFDRVLVVEDGRIIEDGAPGALTGRASRYRELVESERALHQMLWQGSHWRHLRLHEGRIETMHEPVERS